MPVFPILMPAQGYAGQSFELTRFDYAAPEEGGRIGGIAGAPPKWTGEWTLSKTLSQELSDEWRAWVTRLRGQQRIFLAADVERRFPRAYRNGFAGLTKAVGGAPFNGIAGTWSQIIDVEGSARLDIDGLPANFAIKAGDYVGFRWDNSGVRRAKVRVIEPVTGNAGGAISLTVEPAVDMHVVPAGAQLHFDNPLCMMKLDMGKTQLTPMDRMGVIRGGTIVGLQVMIP